jgi:hypothetical protein
MKRRLIYCLKCPFTKDIHYIGKSTNGMLRPSQHLRKSHSLKIQEWVEELKSLGQKPEIGVLYYAKEEEDLDFHEKRLIKEHIEKGAILLNINLVNVSSVLPTILEEEIKKSSLGEIGLFIKNRRMEKGLTQERFSELIGVSITVLRGLEQGSDKGFNTTQVNIVLSAFGCKLGVVNKYHTLEDM